MTVQLLDHAREAYDAVDFDILWQIVSQDLPPLVAIFEKIIPSDDV